MFTSSGGTRASTRSRMPVIPRVLAKPIARAASGSSCARATDAKTRTTAKLEHERDARAHVEAVRPMVVDVTREVPRVDLEAARDLDGHEPEAQDLHAAEDARVVPVRARAYVVLAVEVREEVEDE